MWVRSQRWRARRGSLCPVSDFIFLSQLQERKKNSCINVLAWIRACWPCANCDAPWCKIGCYASFGRWILVLCWLTPFLATSLCMSFISTSPELVCLWIQLHDPPMIGSNLKDSRSKVHLVCNRFHFDIRTNSRSTATPVSWWFEVHNYA